jgi:hypothetical protein
MQWLEHKGVLLNLVGAALRGRPFREPTEELPYIIFLSAPINTLFAMLYELC